jgi:hypothetical protein
MSTALLKVTRLLLPVFVLLTCTAEAQFLYTTNNGTITITGYTGPGGSVIIPATINGLSVTAIGSDAFSFTDTLTAVTLPNSVTGIGEWAFDSCSSLTNVAIGTGVTNISSSAFQYCTSLSAITLPNSLISIGDSAFYSCTALTNIAIPSSVASVGVWAFSQCDSLASVSVNAANPAFSSAGGVLFNKARTVLIQCPGGMTGSYTLSNTVTTIGDYAFSGCGGLTSVTLTNAVARIGDSAFDTCAGLMAVTIGNSATNVGTYAFNDCSNLVAVTLGTNIAAIGDGAFYSCTSLTNLAIPGNVTYIGSSSFYGCSSLTSAVIPNRVGAIGTYAYYSCDNLSSVAIGSGATNIGGYAFSLCSSLTSITVNAANPSYSSANAVLFNKAGTALIQCPNGKAGSYVLPASVTTIGDAAFQYCDSLATVTVPAGVTNIGNSAFADCDNMESVYYEGNLTPSLGATVFSGTPNATVYYASGAAGWSAAFGGRPALPFPFTYSSANGGITITGYNGPGIVVAIPGIIVGLPVTTIGANAFAGCSNLAGITIPAGVTNIGNNAFQACPSLVGVFFEGNAPAMVGANVFNGTTNASVHYPAGATGWALSFSGRPASTLPFNYSVANGTVSVTGYIGSGGAVAIPDTINGFAVSSVATLAFNSSTMTAVILPNSVTAIGDQAFTFCSGLTSITVDPLNYAYSSADGVLFNRGRTALLQYPPGRTGSYTIPGGTTSIAKYAFQNCAGLTTVTIPGSVGAIGDYEFNNCSSLTGVYYQGNAPSVGSFVFQNNAGVTNYYLPGTLGWSTSLGGRPTWQWWISRPLVLSSSPSFGVQTNRFGFLVSWATNSSVVIEACNNLASPAWSPVATNALSSGTAYFSDAQWTNHPARFYRVRGQ